ncbi:MAG: hypothetical protein EP343_21430 [Deltaproteobacteria bacterium]|nr:MAG: hypothetical protein EP343_21430 [Deltaproteobacteria bacterium]
MRIVTLLLLFLGALTFTLAHPSCSPVVPSTEVQPESTQEIGTQREPTAQEVTSESPQEQTSPQEFGPEGTVEEPLQETEPSNPADASEEQDGGNEEADEQTPESKESPEASEPSVERPPLLEIPLVTQCTIPGNPASDSFQVKRDLVFATMDGQKQELDVAWPKTPGPHPLVVMIHGGSWRAGDKDSYKNTILWLTGMGYAAATINYRLANAPKNVFPAAVQDVRCAIRWLRANAQSYRIDPKRVAVVGFSAGAHLAAMLGTADNVKGLDSPDCPVTSPSVKVQAVVSYSGIYELTTSSLSTGKPDPRVVNFLGQAPKDNLATAKLASPLYHLDKNDPPTLMHHGDADTVVPVQAARLYKIALESIPLAHRYIEIKGGTHTGVFNRDAKYRAATCTTLQFLKMILQP